MARTPAAAAAGTTPPAVSADAGGPTAGATAPLEWPVVEERVAVAGGRTGGGGAHLCPAALPNLPRPRPRRPVLCCRRADRRDRRAAGRRRRRRTAALRLHCYRTAASCRYGGGVGGQRSGVAVVGVWGAVLTSAPSTDGSPLMEWLPAVRLPTVCHHRQRYAAAWNRASSGPARDLGAPGPLHTYIEVECLRKQIRCAWWGTASTPLQQERQKRL